MTNLEIDAAAGQGAPWLPAHIADETRLVSLPFGRVFVCDVHPGASAVEAVFVTGRGRPAAVAPPGR